MGGWRTPAAVVIAVLASALGACSSSDDETGSVTTSYELKPSIALVVNDWTASALNVAIAEQLIERHLGYPVLPTRIDDTAEIYAGLTEGSLDAVLEIWPSAMSSREQQYLESGLVEPLGELGPVGKVGWWVPRYVVESDPALASWTGFQDPSAAARFATPETEPNGRFLGANDGYFQFDEEIIANLGLPLSVEFSGSEAATKAELEAKVAANEPLLLYWWTPTAQIAQFDLVNVALPESTEACRAAAEAGDGSVDCDYPEDRLLKAVSPKLEEKAPDALSFLRAFTLTTDDQLALLLAVEYDGLTVDQAAAAWIEANADRWEPWLEE